MPGHVQPVKQPCDPNRLTINCKSVQMGLDPKFKRKPKFNDVSILIGTIVINLLGLCFPLFMLQVYDRILPFRSHDTLYLLSAVVFFVVLLEALLRYLRALISASLAAQFEHKAMAALFSKTLKGPTQLVEERGVGRLLNDFKSISSLKSYYGGQTYQQFLDLPFVVIYIAVIAFINPLIACTVVTGYSIFLLFLHVYSQRAGVASGAFREIEGRRSNFLIEVFKNTHTLKALSMEPSMMRRYERLQSATAQLYAKLAFVLDMAGNFGSIFSSILTATVIALSAWTVIQGGMTNGELAATVLLTLRSVSPLQRFGGLLARRQQDVRLIKELSPDTLIDHSLHENQGSDIYRLQVGEPNASKFGVVVKNLSFQYPMAPQDLLTDFSITIEPGECVELSGDSGSGKSTILQLVKGILSPTGGSVSFFGVEGLANKKLPRISYLSTATSLLFGTILDNITGFDESRREQAMHVAEALGLDDLVASLPAGWLTEVGDAAVDVLPPGYSQIIGIVRSLALSPSIVLFDEANTNLDMETDKKLLEYLESIKGNVTIILVTRRPSYRGLSDRTINIRPVFHEATVLSQTQTNHEQTPSEALSSDLKVDTLVLSSDQRVDSDDRVQANYIDLKPVDKLSNLETTLLGILENTTDFQKCLPVLLQHLKYDGTLREVTESLPYFIKSIGLSDLNNTLSYLGFSVVKNTGNLHDIDPRFLPALFVPKNQPAFVLTWNDKQGYIAKKSMEETHIPDNSKNIYGDFYYYHGAIEGEKNTANWTRSIITRFFGALPALLLFSFLIGVVLLAAPLFLILVYGAVIPSGSLTFLIEMLVAVFLCNVIALFAYRQKARLLSHVAERTEYVMGTSILERIFSMPPTYTERASIGAQYARVKGFEGIRDGFHSPLGSTFFDIPTTIIIAIALSLVNHLAAWVILCAVLIYFVIYRFLTPSLNAAVVAAGYAANKRNEFLTEAILKLRLIKELDAQNTWLERFRKVSANATASALKASFLSTVLSSVGYFIMMISGLTIVVITIPSVWDGFVGSSILIVSMALMWRVLNPVQSLFANLTRFEGLLAAARQIDALMRIKSERFGFSKVTTTRVLSGDIDFKKLSFRYSANADPALLSVDFSIKRGELIGVCGSNGSGKTTLMRLILGMHQQQAGKIHLDGIDMRQFDPMVLRRSMGYAPQEIQMYRATIAQNLQLVKPDADERTMRNALSLAGALEQVNALPDQMNHRLGDTKRDLPDSLMRKLVLARAYITDAPIIILDEPSTNLDDTGSKNLTKFFEENKGKKTVIFSSHRPSHLRLADKVMLFDKGYLLAAGAPDEVLFQSRKS